jgi:hypothetical protein
MGCLSTRTRQPWALLSCSFLRHATRGPNNALEALTPGNACYRGGEFRETTLQRTQLPRLGTSQLQPIHSKTLYRSGYLDDLCANQAA